MARELKCAVRGYVIGEFSRTRRGGMIIDALVVVLLVLWLMGVVYGQTFGGLLHALLIVAAIVFIFRLVSGRAVA